jgi:hypothetical protein
VAVEVYERTLLLTTRGFGRANEREIHQEGVEALNDHASRSLKRSVSAVGRKKRLLSDLCSFARITLTFTSFLSVSDLLRP